MSKNYVAIMAGGIGSRFWPSSRAHRPKQFLDILGVGKSLIQLTYERFAKVVPEEHIFIVTNEQYKQLVKQHLPKVTDNQILCEPSRNNTAPCVAYTAFKLRSLDPDANFVVAPLRCPDPQRGRIRRSAPKSARLHPNPRGHCYPRHHAQPPGYGLRLHQFRRGGGGSCPRYRRRGPGTSGGRVQGKTR